MISSTWTFLCAAVVHLVSAELKPFVKMQKLDHFNPRNNKTFPQRYWIVDDFFDPERNTPILLFLGLAAPFSTAMLTGVGTYAPLLSSHKALGVGIENRFYGRSLTSRMLTINNLQYLTTAQGLEDTAQIQDEVNAYVRRLTNANTDRKWIAFGGSYSGLKAIVHRMKMPDRFYAAYASSAPINFQYDMPMYPGHVGEILADPNNVGPSAAQCYAKVKEAFERVDKLLDSNQFEMIRRDFNICRINQDWTEKDKYAIGRHLGGLLMDTFQMSYSNPATNVYTSICVPFTRQDSIVYPYDTLIRLRNDKNGGKCDNVSYAQMLQDFTAWGNGIDDWTEYEKNPGGRAWGYEICGTMGFNAYCDPNRMCPLSRHMNRDGQINFCNDAYRISERQMMSTNARFLTEYGGPSPRNISRLVLTHGATDLGFNYEWTTSDDENQIWSKVTPFVGHVIDMNAAQPFDPVVLYETRDFVSRRLGTFIEEASSGVAYCTVNKLFIVLVFAFHFLLN